MKIQVLAPAPWSASVNKAIARARSYHGPQPRTEALFDCLIQYKNDRALIIPLATAGSVAMTLANPIPYRGVSVGVAAGGVFPSISVGASTVSAPSTTWHTTIKNSSGGVVGGFDGRSDSIAHAGVEQTLVFSNLLSVSGGNVSVAASIVTPPAGSPVWMVWSGTSHYDGSFLGDPIGSWAPVSPSYESILAADITAGTGGTYTYVVASNGEVLAREAQNDVSVASVDGTHLEKWYVPGSTEWSGGGYCDMFTQYSSVFTYSHKLTFDVPEDCIYPVTPSPPPYPGASAVNLSVVTTGSPAGLGDNMTGTVSGAYTSTLTISGPGGTYTVVGTYSLSITNTGPPFHSGYGIGSTCSRSAINLPTNNPPSTSVPGNSVGVLISGLYSHVGLTTGGESGTFGLNTSGVGSTYDWSIGSSFSCVAVSATPEYIAASQAPADVVRWNTDWFAAQAALAVRRKNWFKKNSDAVLAALAAGGYTLPPAWDYALKRNAPTSAHTYRPILVNSSYVDSSSTDDAGNLHFVRTATLSYDITVDGVVQHREQVFVGTQDQENTPPTDTYPGSRVTTYANWWVPALGSFAPSGVSRSRKQFLRDMSAQDEGLGLLWNGSLTTAPNQPFSDSTYGEPNLYVPIIAFSPPLPAFSDTLAGTAPQFILDYRKDVPIAYNASAPGSTAWNDSALQDGQTVTLVLFGPAGKGCFGEWTTDDTTIDVFGAATYSYSTGVFTQTSWKPCTARAVSLEGIAQPATNSVVKYGDLRWSDVVVAAKAANTARKPPVPPADDSRTDVQKLTYLVLAALSN